MKKSALILAALSFTLLISSCKTEPKKPIEKEATFSLSQAGSTISWTAYKTTDKIAVKGSFKTVNITKNGNGNTIKEAVNNSEFSIPVSSIFSANADRDSKLLKFFFGVMDNTELLSGKLTLGDDHTGVATLTMNSITKDFPITYSITGKIFNLNATIDMGNWNANEAIDSLNVACKELHKAADGISKTWNVVDIQITSFFK